MAASLPPAGFGAAALGGSCCRTEGRWDLTEQRGLTSDRVLNPVQSFEFVQTEEMKRTMRLMKTQHVTRSQVDG